jgi:hypothetical protein
LTVGNFGRRFQGKTTLGVSILDEHTDRRALLDPRGLIRRCGAIVVRRKDKLRVAFDALAAGDVDEIVYSPIEPHAEAFRAFAGELHRWVIEYPDVELGVLIDEASFYGALDAVESFMVVLKSCQLDRFHIVLTCHRPTDLPVDVRALLNRWHIFRTTQEHDLDAIRRRCQHVVADEVQQLDEREFVKWDDDDGTYEVNRLASYWAVDLIEPGAEQSILVLQ